VLQRLIEEADLKHTPLGSSSEDRIPKGAELTSLAISPMDAKTAYASDAAKLYKTTGGGKSWAAVATS
jgi:photosystem II stability/assembly factor-like uncharacterized protein